jgi:hypothetical protein
MLSTRASHMIMRSQRKFRPNQLLIHKFPSHQFLNQLFKLLNQSLPHRLSFKDHQFTMQLVYQCKLLFNQFNKSTCQPSKVK